MSGIELVLPSISSAIVSSIFSLTVSGAPSVSAQEPSSVSISSPASIPSAKFSPGASEPARVQPPRPRDEAEAKILSVLDALDHYREGTSNVPREDGRMLRLLAEAGGTRNVVELGTSNGYSGLWFSLALSKTGGRLTTFDIDKGRFEMARNNFKKAGVDGIVTQVLGDAHKEVARLKDPIDRLNLPQATRLQPLPTLRAWARESRGEPRLRGRSRRASAR